MNTIPEEAAGWVSSYLSNVGRSLPDYKEASLRSSGLDMLTVTDLKALWRGLEPVVYKLGLKKRKPSSSSKKADWVKATRTCFYQDDHCRRVDKTFMKELKRTLVPPTVTPPANAAAGAAAARTAAANAATARAEAASRAVAAAAAHAARTSPTRTAAVKTPPTKRTSPAKKRKGASHTKKRRISPASAARPAAMHPRPVPWMPPTMAHHGMPTHPPAGIPYPAVPSAHVPYPAFATATGVPFPPQTFNPWASLPLAPPHATHRNVAPPHATHRNVARIPSPRKTSRSQNGSIVVKSEPPGNYNSTSLSSSANSEETPQTPQEWQMVQSLKQMGFTDMREILAGIRHVLAVDMASRVDDAMMWIVSQREEAEEARKLDLARISSEALRTEQARKNAMEAQRRLLNDSMQELQNTHFAGSVLLNDAKRALETLERKDLIRLLQLEKKARKWYGTAVPWCYFAKMCTRFNNLDKARLSNEVKTESDQLERAMYSLSEQQGGVPRLFLEARNEAKSKGLQTGPEQSCGDVDGDVVVVEELPPKVQTETKTPALKNGSNQKIEIIDLL